MRSPRRPLLLASVAVAFLALAAGTFARVAVAARAGGALTVRACGMASSGPGALRKASGKGAECLLNEFEHRCRPTKYELSRFGVDTVASQSFVLASRSGRCQVEVSATFSVVPQPAHVSGHGVCTGLRRRGNDIIAVGCKGPGLAATSSLTGAL
jgi:hypothetical protein